MDTFLGLDATLLARIQFGFTVSFHFIFPSITKKYEELFIVAPKRQIEKLLKE